MLLVADAFIVRARSHESAVGGSTHDNSIGRENCASRRDIEPGPRSAANWMGCLVDYRRITRGMERSTPRKRTPKNLKWEAIFGQFRTPIVLLPESGFLVAAITDNLS